MILFSVPTARIEPSPRLIRLAWNISSSSGIRLHGRRLVTGEKQMSSRRNGDSVATFVE